MNWFLMALKKYATFSGRAQRAEYWYFFLFYILIFVALGFVEGMTHSGEEAGGMGFLTGIVALGLFLPSLGVGIRRLHDTGRSGWWLLVGLIPVVGAIVLLIFAVQDSQAGDNEYGPNPKA